MEYGERSMGHSRRYMGLSGRRVEYGGRSMGHSRRYMRLSGRRKGRSMGNSGRSLICGGTCLGCIAVTFIVYKVTVTSERVHSS